MPTDKIQKTVVGHAIDESPYPPDTGPTEIRADGQIAFHGTMEGFQTSYVISGNRIIAASSYDITFLFYLDRKGRPYYRMEDGRNRDFARPLRLVPLPIQWP